MRTRTGPVTAALVTAALALAACGNGTGGGAPAAPSPGGDAFQSRANQVAEIWRTAPPTGAWTSGFVPLSELTTKPTTTADGQPLDEATSAALNAGFLVLDTSLPGSSPSEADVSFADGQTLKVGLVDAKAAYRAVAPANSASCDSGAPEQSSSSGDPDDPTTHKVPCTKLHVTKAVLGSTPLQTSRGTAFVPAWLFTVDGLSGMITRVAVAPEDIAEVPQLPVPPSGELPGLVAAQDLVSVNGNEITYRLGVGACDTDITPLFLETDSAVVVAGSVVRSTQECIELLKYAPVTITLAKPLGARPLVSAHTGQALAAPNF